ncbi:MAG: tol-pal system protein YbgF [Syntrophaceae bacterium]
MRRIAWFWPLITVAIILTGCASQQDLNTLKFELNALQTKEARLEQTQKDLMQKQGAGDKQKEQFLTQQADMQAQFTELQTQILSLQGKLEEMAAAPKIDGRDLEARVKALEDALSAGAKTQDAAAAQAVTAKSQYDVGLERFKAGKYDEALKAFDSYLAQGSDQTLAGNANFWAGESLAASGKYEDAILRYDVVIKQYPKSNKMPDALYKQGIAFIQLGDKEAGNLLLRRVAKDFPDSEPGKKAKKQLKIK